MNEEENVLSVGAEEVTSVPESIEGTTPVVEEQKVEEVKEDEEVKEVEVIEAEKIIE